MPQWTRHHLIIVAAAAIVLLTNLGGPRLWDDDEPRNAGCAAEMLQRGDWVVPVFNGELRAHKPVLLYWLMMTAYSALGVNEFAARFWSALLGIGTVVMTYHLGRRLFDSQAGLWAALSLAPALMFGVAGRAATPDSVLIFCSTLAIFAYVMLSPKSLAQGENARAPANSLSFKHAACIYAAMGLAVLAKGPVGLVLPTAVIGMYLLIVRLPAQSPLMTSTWSARLPSVARPFAPQHFLTTCWAMRPLTAIGVALAVALPWYLWVHHRTEGAWTEGFFIEHNLHRATQAMEGHRGNVLFYPATLLVGFFPWSVFLAPLVIDTVAQLRRRSAASPGYVLALCWVGVYVGMFSLAKTKLPSYVTPCYPGVALLMGAFVSRLVRHEHDFSRAWLRLVTGVSMVVGIALLGGLPWVAHVFVPGEEWLACIGLAPLIAGAIGWLFVNRREFSKLAASYGACAVAFSTMLLAIAPQRIDSHQHSNELLAAIYARSVQPEIGHLHYLEPTWVFYSEQSLTNLKTAYDPASMTDEKLPVPNSRRWERQPKTPVKEFLAGGANRFVITTPAAWELAKAEAPTDCEIIAEVPYFLRSERLIVVGRAQPAIATALQALPARLQRFR